MAEHEEQKVADTDRDPESLHPGTQEPSSGGIEGPSAALLIVLGEVHSPEQKELALRRVVSGLSSWDVTAAGFDLEQPLLEFLKLQPKGVTDPNGETVLEQKLKLLEIIILVNPRYQTVQKKLVSFLQSKHRYRFVLYSGLTLQSSGCWFLQDGSFGFSSFSDVFHQPDVRQATADQQNTVLDISIVAEVGEWTKGSISKLSSPLQLRLNPPASEKSFDSIQPLSDFLSAIFKVPSCDDLLKSTNTCGNFAQGFPTMHVFPAGRGDSALFGVSGFNLLFDGGYRRHSCFWELTRHLPSLDAVLISHLGPDNLFGIESFLDKKTQDKGFPELGAVFFNPSEAKQSATTDSNQGLLLNLAEKGKQILDKVHQIGSPVIHCLGTVHSQVLHPVNLYHKVGHGTIDLYILNPLAENKDTKETKSIGGSKGGGLSTTDHLSICSLLVWKPVSVNDKPVRILFPGNTPQARIFEGLERLKTVTMFQSASGISDKSRGVSKGPEKTAGKTLVGKEKPPQAPKIESKETKKPTVEQKTGNEQTKETKKVQEQKDVKKTVAGEQKDNKRSASAEARNSKGNVTVKKDAPLKTTAPAAKTAKKTESEPVKLSAKKSMTKQTGPVVQVPVDSEEKEKPAIGIRAEDEKVITNKTAEFPPPSEPDQPLIIPSEADEGKDVEVQALPEPIVVEEAEEEEVVRSEVEKADGNVEMEEEAECSDVNSAKSEEVNGGCELNQAAFDPTKEWGIPDGLPAPMNGKEPASSKRTTTAHNQSMVTTGSNAKKTDVAKTTDAATSKVATKRPVTAPERLNNTTREDAEKDDKTSANQSLMIKGRPSTSQKDAAGVAKKQQQPMRPVVPFYVDVAYIPGHGSLNHFDIDFFRRIRARYYILSSISPDPKVLALLIEAKETWNGSPSAEVTVIPTYDSESFISWIMENAEKMKKLNITISPPAYKCTMQLQEIDTICASYRLEF